MFQLGAQTWLYRLDALLNALESTCDTDCRQKREFVCMFVDAVQSAEGRKQILLSDVFFGICIPIVGSGMIYTTENAG